MRLSRDELNWTAPTVNVDGTPIDYPLDYELGAGPDDASIEPVVTVVGTLQPDGNYTAPLEPMSWELGSYRLALRAINRDDPSSISAWSNTIALVVTDPTPAAPVLLDA